MFAIPSCRITHLARSTIPRNVKPQDIVFDELVAGADRRLEAPHILRSPGRPGKAARRPRRPPGPRARPAAIALARSSPGAGASPQNSGVRSSSLIRRPIRGLSPSDPLLPEAPLSIPQMLDRPSMFDISNRVQRVPDPRTISLNKTSPYDQRQNLGARPVSIQLPLDLSFLLFSFLQTKAFGLL